MEAITAYEKRNSRIALLTTLSVHAALFALFFFLLAWSEPDPPIPEFGIELSYVGSNPAERSQNQLQQQSREAGTLEQMETEDTAAKEQSEAEAEAEETARETDAAEISEPEPAAEEVQEQPSPDKIPETQEQTAAQQQRESTAPQENAAAVSESEDRAEQPTLDHRALYTGAKGSTHKQAGSEGASYQLSGWEWDFEPEPDDRSQESGIVKFRIKVDNEGEIIYVETIEKTVSPAVEKKYKAAVYELTFSKTADNHSTAPTSTGTITFIIKSR